MDWLEKGQAEAKKQLKKAKRKAAKPAKEARNLRQQTQEYYDKFKVESTAVDGLVFRSNLEALWYEELKDCESFTCFECVHVPVWICGKTGRFQGTYSPDFSISLADGSTTLVELKPNHKLAMADDRQKRALEINPQYRFVVIGGYPYSTRGVTIRLLTGTKELVRKNVQVCDVLNFLECECDDT